MVEFGWVAQHVQQQYDQLSVDGAGKVRGVKVRTRPLCLGQGEQAAGHRASIKDARSAVAGHRLKLWVVESFAKE